MILISFDISNSTNFLTSSDVSSLFDTISGLKSSLFSMHLSGSQYFSVYDTAFLSLIHDNSGKPIFTNSLKFLFSSVNPDGSWGNPNILSDNILSTLASMHALQQSHLYNTPIVQNILAKAEKFIFDNYNRIAQENFFTVGLEFLLPNLLLKTGVNLFDHPMTKKLETYQQKKLSVLPLDYIQQIKSPMLFALESLDSHCITSNLDHFIEANGSIATSPATTAWYLNYNPKSDKIPEMIRYLSDLYNPQTGGVPSFADYSLMNIPFVLYPLFKARIPYPNYNTLLRYVYDHWTPTGVGHSSCFPMTDADDTALSLLLLNKFYFIPDNSEKFDVLLRYKRQDYFITYPFEIGTSNMVNLHVLDMLLETNASKWNREFNIDQLVSFIAKQISPEYGIGGDKYHYSPYCQNCHAVLTLSKNYPSLSRKLVDWLFANQDINGLWGITGPTVEETAYAVLALCYYHIHAEKLDLTILNNAIDYLVADHGPYPNLWLSKVAYTPIETVKAHILAALELYHQAVF